MVEERRRYSPYQGLIPYMERDASFFFGREKETRLIIANLFASPLTLLYGPSGVGKSSVLRAGVVFQLRQRQNLKVFVLSDWKGDPLEKLRAILESANQRDRSASDRPGKDLSIQAPHTVDERFMVILDQFEEFFLYHPREDAFTEEFSRAVMQFNSPTSFLISIREDALARLDRFEGRIPILFDNYLRIEHLDEEAARSAIEKPIAEYNRQYPPVSEPMRIEPELVTEVLEQLKSGRVTLVSSGGGLIAPEETRRVETPYLQLVMTRIWEQEILSSSKTLRLKTLHALGNAPKIVRDHLDKVMNRLTSDHQLLASKLFQYLVTPSGTKIALSASDLASFVDIPTQTVEALLQRLSEQDIRLLRAFDTKDHSHRSYEIFHDVLTTPVLHWRDRWLSRHKLKRRVFLLASILVLIALFVMSVGYLALQIFASSEDTTMMVFICVLPLLVVGLISGMIGFFIGMGWVRTK